MINKHCGHRRTVGGCADCRIAELEAEVARLHEDLENLTMAKETVDQFLKWRRQEVERLREVIRELSKIAPQNNARAAILATLKEKAS